MKPSKLNSKIGFILCQVITCLLFLYSCDTFETDPDLKVPNADLQNKELVVMANGSIFIDLATQIKSNVPVNLKITSSTKNGALTELGQGLLQYQPSTGSQKGEDAFEFAVYSQTNQLIKKDTVVIVIENDSTQLPCGVYPMDDYVYNVHGDTAVIINVLANDFICAIDSADVRISIHHPDNTFPPYAGHASVVNNQIRYQPGESFDGEDKMLYKIQSATNPAIVAYGVVYITHQSYCSLVAVDDWFMIDSLDQVLEHVFIPAFDNDQLCDSIYNHQITIVSQPAFGSALLATNGFLYSVNSSEQVDDGFSDSFRYEICLNGQCTSAEVTLMIVPDSASTCPLSAVMDSVQMTNSFSVMTIDVLVNDTVCGDSLSLTISAPPSHATQYWITEGKKINYLRDPLLIHAVDSLEYQICNTEKCSRAKVLIQGLN